jgi:hypothetical protein
MAGTETPHHHGDHRNLVWKADDSSPQASVDAIIVPTARPVVYLKDAAAAALSLGCPLVTLHSQKWTSAHEAFGYLGQTIDLIAIDMPEAGQLRLPQLETTRLLAGTPFERRTDVSDKRNLALVLCRTLGWERVVFLDDDIRVPNPADLRMAAGLLNTHAAVGLGIGGFPDNSMVCHAFREAGGRQATFPGGGALAVEVKRNRSFFPNVYNEDWFYMLDADKRLQSVATVGQVLQYPYDPYLPERARNEEFGDVLAEGTFWLLDQGKTVADGDLAHWRGFLEERRIFIEQVRAMVSTSADIKPDEQRRMTVALTAALVRLRRITPHLCVDFLHAWAADQTRWQRHIQSVPCQPHQSRDSALRSLARKGGTRLVWCTSQGCSVPEPAARPGRPWTMPLLGPWRPGDHPPPVPSPDLAPRHHVPPRPYRPPASRTSADLVLGGPANGSSPGEDEPA